MAQLQDRACRRGSRHAHNTRDILPEIVDVHALLRFGDRKRRKLDGRADERNILCNDFRRLTVGNNAVCRKDCRSFPGRIVIVRLVPAVKRFFDECVIFEAVEDIVVQDRSIAVEAPRIIRNNHIACAVGVKHGKLSVKRKRRAETAQRTVEPTVAEIHADGVCTAFDKVGHVKGLIEHVVVIRRHAGIEHAVGHALAVDVSVVRTGGRGIQTGGFDSLIRIHGEILAEHRRTFGFYNAGGFAQNDRRGKLRRIKRQYAVHNRNTGKAVQIIIVKISVQKNVAVAVLDHDIIGSKALGACAAETDVAKLQAGKRARIF